MEKTEPPETDEAPRRIACYPVDRTNSYHTRLYRALADYGYLCDLNPPHRGWRLRDKIAEEEILHLHWATEDFYRDGGLYRSLRLLARFVLDLASLRRRGKKIVWTCHNLFPHERHRRWMDWLAHFALAQAAHCILVHAHSVRRRIRRMYRRSRNVDVIPFGTYAGDYAVPEDGAEARRRLGIPDDGYVYLFLGNIREYKGVADLVAAFRTLGDAEATLLIVGRVRGEAMSSLLDQAEKTPGIRVIRSGKEEDFARALAAADALALPFRRMTSSGSCYLGPNYGLPVILPDLEFPRELFGEDYPLFFKAGSVGDLARCMRTARRTNVSALKSLYDAINARCTWAAAARETARALDGLFEKAGAARRTDEPEGGEAPSAAPTALWAVIVLYNGVKWYRACLASLGDAGIPPERTIVVDNASTDGSGDRVAAEFPRVTLHRMPRNTGAAGGANRGLRMAMERGAGALLLLNSDVIVTPEMPRRLLEAARDHPEYGILSPAQYNYAGDRLDENFARMHPAGQLAAAELLDAETVIAAGVLITRRAIERIGDFDPEYFVYGEEDDFCRRARHHGIKVGVVSRAVLRHWHAVLNTGLSPRMRRLRFRNQFLYVLKDPTHPLPKHLYCYIRYYVWRRLAAAVRRRDWRTAAAVLGAQLGLLCRVRRILRNRRKEREGPWRP